MSRITLGVSVLLLALACAAPAQTVSSQISGTVFDVSGAVVPGAQVAVRNTATGASRKATTNETGYYVFPDLLPGPYELAVEREGFKRSVESGITLNANSRITVNATLSPGMTTEVIQVSATVNQVETSTGEISAVVSSRQVTGLSLNGRNYIQLLMLIPGVTVDYTSSFNSITSVSSQHVNGLRGNTSGLMVDGAYNLDVGSNGTQLVNPSVDSIQEVKISTNSYSAEYGHAQGAQINVVTKSGTQQFHGAAFEFLRNDKLDANDWISNRSGRTNPPLRFHDYGGNIGGPIFLPNRWNTDRQKAFFFFSASGRHNTLGTTRTGNVPTAEERNGDFRNSALAAPVNPATRQPYDSGNPRVLPRSVFSRNGPVLLKPYPLPNTSGPGFNYVTQTIASNPQEEQILRIDYNLSEKTQTFFRWIRDLFDSTDTSNGSALGIVGNTNRRHGTALSLNVSRTFSPTLVNVFNFSLTGNRINNFPVTDNFRWDGLGLSYPKLFPSNRFQAGPDVSIQGFTGYGIGANLQNFQWLFVWRDDLTWVKGNHSMKFGVWIERFRKNANVLQGAPRDNGTVSFSRTSGITTGNPIADVLVGNFQSYGEASQDSVVFTRYTQFEAYAQDNWRVRPKLRSSTVTAALFRAPATSSVDSMSTASRCPAAAGRRERPAVLRPPPTPPSTPCSVACRAVATTPNTTTSGRACRLPGTPPAPGNGPFAAARASPMTASATAAPFSPASACRSSTGRRSLTPTSTSRRPAGKAQSIPQRSLPGARRSKRLASTAIASVSSAACRPRCWPKSAMSARSPATSPWPST